MSEEMQIDGKSYISSKRAAEMSGYAQDYVGQLARKSLIDAQRIGGLWYISMDSLGAYQKKADDFKPTPPERPETSAPETLVFFDGKEYLSAGKAAELTGYTQDYVGQLARSGTVLSRQVGTRWYVDREGIVQHKKEKDGLLAAVQSQSVGLKKSELVKTDMGLEPFFNYFSESGALIPLAEKSPSDDAPLPAPSHPVPIRRERAVSSYKPSQPRYSGTAIRAKSYSKGNLGLLVGSVATIVIVLSASYATVLHQDPVYAVKIEPRGGAKAVAGSAEAVMGKVGDFLEPYVTRELSYERKDSN